MPADPAGMRGNLPCSPGERSTGIPNSAMPGVYADSKSLGCCRARGDSSAAAAQAKDSGSSVATVVGPGEQHGDGAGLEEPRAVVHNQIGDTSGSKHQCTNARPGDEAFVGAVIGDDGVLQSQRHAAVAENGNPAAGTSG